MCLGDMFLVEVHRFCFNGAIPFRLELDKVKRNWLPQTFGWTKEIDQNPCFHVSVFQNCCKKCSNSTDQLQPCYGPTNSFLSSCGNWVRISVTRPIFMTLWWFDYSDYFLICVWHYETCSNLVPICGWIYRNTQLNNVRLIYYYVTANKGWVGLFLRIGSICFIFLLVGSK